MKRERHFGENEIVCHCFGYTKGEIEADFRKNGFSAIVERIRKEKSRGGCDCGVKHPEGR